jgi:oligopeptidase A
MTNPLLEERGLPLFSQIEPEHVEAALDQTLQRNRDELAQILGRSSEPDFPSTITPLEEMEDRLHRVWSPVSHLQMVASTDEMREVYNACLPKLSRYSTELGQNEALFKLYQTVNSAFDAADTTPQKRLLEHALRDFRLAGVDLPAEKKAQFKQVMEELSQLQAKFEQNLLDAMKAWSKHVSDEELLAGIPEAVIDAARTAATEQDKDGWLLHLDQPTYVAVLTHADSADLREEFYAAWVTRASDQGPTAGQFDNTAIMEDLLRLRHEAANLVGFDNFADYALASRMASTTQEVSDFLQHLADVSGPVAKQELAELEAWVGRKLAPWDVGYYSEKLRLERFSISDEELRPYFPLTRVMDGLFQVLKQLYGITAEAQADVDLWEPDVLYYTLTNAKGEKVGSFYADLYARRNKRSGAWMDECLLRKKLDGNLQTPVAHLVCNYTKPADGKPTLLSHDEIVTLFHEFGHTLHHLLTRIDFPSVSGINGVPWDAVELPSQFMENFAWSPDVIRSMSQHVVTGAALPDELLQKLEASRVFQSGMQMARQLEFSIFDWRMHAEYSPQHGGRIQSILDEVHDQIGVMPLPDYNRFANSFAHVFGGGYAAGYYSYKWAEVLAADAFSAFQEAGLFDQQTADKFRSNILEVGGAVDIAEAFQAFRGRPPKIEPLLAQAGIIDPHGQVDSTS